MSPRILVLGSSLRPLEPVPVVGEVLGLTRATSFRIAEADDWPTIGPRGARRVIVPALLERMGVAYEIEADDDVR